MTRQVETSDSQTTGSIAIAPVRCADFAAANEGLPTPGSRAYHLWMRSAFVFIAGVVLLAGCGGGSTATGRPVIGPDDIGNLLGPGDFVAVGLAGASAPRVEPGQVTDEFANVVAGAQRFNIFYAGDGMMSGGLQLDVLLFATPADARNDFSDFSGFGTTLDTSAVQAIGGDQASLVDNETNGFGPHYSKILVLKGKGWFEIGVPSGPRVYTQLPTLAQLVVARGTALFG